MSENLHSNPMPQPRKEAAQSGILRIGHRGAAGYAPENTLAGIWKARSLRIDMVELDLRETGDGHLVLLHDETVDRTTDKTGRLDQVSLEQAQRLNAGHWQCIPTLEQALDAAGHELGLILELKVEGIGMDAREVVVRSGFNGTVLYASFLFDELMRIRSTDPTTKIMPLFGDHLPADPVRDALALNASYVGLSYHTLTPALVKTYHDLGLRVFVYTVNDVRDIQHSRDLQVDGIISDFPDRI
ncbi:MAG: glycerophosphodiester phosphodiesterase [Nitrospiraceae bacterium]